MSSIELVDVDLDGNVVPHLPEKNSLKEVEIPGPTADILVVVRTMCTAPVDGAVIPRLEVLTKDGWNEKTSQKNNVLCDDHID